MSFHLIQSKNTLCLILTAGTCFSVFGQSSSGVLAQGTRVAEIKKSSTQKKSPAADRNINGKTGTQIVLEMCRTYQNADSFQDRSEAKMTQLNGTQFIQTNLTRFKKPNMIVIESRDLSAGTFTTYASGTLITVFSGKQNVFMRNDSPKDLTGTFKRIQQTVLDTMGTNSDQVLSPMSFLIAKKGLPDEASELKLEGTEKVDGHQIYKVTGKASLHWFQKMIPANNRTKIIPDQRDVALWIDAQSHLLVKAAATLSFHVIYPKSGTQPATKVSDGIAFTETHSNTVINPTFTVADFTFKEPKNVKQIYPQIRH